MTLKETMSTSCYDMFPRWWFAPASCAYGEICDPWLPLAAAENFWFP